MRHMNTSTYNIYLLYLNKVTLFSGGLAHRDTEKVPGEPAVIITLGRCRFIWIKNYFIKIMYLRVLYLIVKF
jgi:hypothetical protein